MGEAIFVLVEIGVTVTAMACDGRMRQILRGVTVSPSDLSAVGCLLKRILRGETLLGET